MRRLEHRGAPTDSHFRKCEDRLRVALACYAFAAVVQLVLLAVGFSSATAWAAGAGLLTSMGAAAGGVLMLGAFIAIFRNTNWPGNAHISIDHRLFGFLSRSNRSIFHTLIYALEPAERSRVLGLGPERQAALTEAVFSEVSNDSFLFERMMRSNLFTLWTWYWIVLYGAVITSALTAISFGFVLFQSDAGMDLLFGCNCLAAVVHVILCNAVGFRLIRRTSHAVEKIVESYRFEIAEMLRELVGAPAEFADAVEDPLQPIA